METQEISFVPDEHDSLDDAPIERAGETSESSTVSSRAAECPYCCKVFKKLAHLREHLLTHTGERPYICDFPDCGKSFTRSSHLKRHLLSHTGEKPFKCTHDGCDSAFATSHRLESHLKLHETPKPYVCSWDGCSAAFSKHNQLKRHVCSHTGEKPYPCTIDGCTSSFAFPSALKKHIATVHESTPCILFACANRPHTLNQCRLIHGAIVSHMEKSLNVCGFTGCSDSFRTFKELQLHIKAAHRQQVKEFFCDICGSSFQNNRNLQEHLNTHSDSRELFRCPHCDKEFTKKSNMKVHINVAHLGERPFECPVEGCGKRFAYKHEMTKHQNKHRAPEQPEGLPPRKKLKSSVEALLGDDHAPNLFVVAPAAASALPSGES